RPWPGWRSPWPCTRAPVAPPKKWRCPRAPPGAPPTPRSSSRFAPPGCGAAVPSRALRKPWGEDRPDLRGEFRKEFGLALTETEKVTLVFRSFGELFSGGRRGAAEAPGEGKAGGGGAVEKSPKSEKSPVPGTGSSREPRPEVFGRPVLLAGLQ